MKLTIFTSSLILLAACAEELPPVSVAQFMENSRLLEATMVRCAQNRAELKYDAECMNAREAVNRLASAEDEERFQQLEAQSERKRQALRRTQEAAADARRRALEAKRQREEDEYLGFFEQMPATGQQQSQISGQSSSQPGGSVAPATAAPPTNVTPESSQPPEDAASVADTSIDEPAASDLQSIREELRRRREEQPQ